MRENRVSLCGKGTTFRPPWETDEARCAKCCSFATLCLFSLWLWSNKSILPCAENYWTETDEVTAASKIIRRRNSHISPDSVVALKHSDFVGSHLRTPAGAKTVAIHFTNKCESCWCYLPSHPWFTSFFSYCLLGSCCVRFHSWLLLCQLLGLRYVTGLVCKVFSMVSMHGMMS